MATRGELVSQLEMALVFLLANTKNIGGRPYNHLLPWQNELERLRLNLINQNIPEPGVSGPWPVEAPWGALVNVYGDFGGNARDEVTQYYAAAAPGENSVSVQCFFPGSVPDAAQPGDPFNELSSHVKLIVGGSQPVRVQGRFVFYLKRFPLPNIPASGTVTTDFPTTFSVGTANGFEAIVSAPVDQMIEPGEYFFNASPGTNSLLLSGGEMFTMSLDPNPYPGVPAMVGSVVVGGPVAAHGIHDTLPIWKIRATVPNEPEIRPFGLYGNRTYNTSNYRRTGLRFVSTVAGLWSGKTGIITGMPDATGLMPWNELNSRGEPVGAAVETLSSPYFSSEFAWTANTDILAGRWLVRNGFWQRATRNGRTGTTLPVWPAAAGQTVTDGTVIWRAYSYFGSRARLFAAPRYPFKRLGDPLLLTPEAWPNWVNFKTGWKNQFSSLYDQYWWLRRIRINRLRGPGADAQQHNAGAEIPVTLGCVRNGNFVPFGTWNTGSWVEVETGDTDAAGAPVRATHFLWPIFDKSALVYQAEERVDVQAEFIAGPPSGGHQINYPILADHLNDAHAVLQQL